jgi:hypothetical protein
VALADLRQRERVLADPVADLASAVAAEVNEMEAL